MPSGTDGSCCTSGVGLSAIEGPDRTVGCGRCVAPWVMLETGALCVDVVFMLWHCGGIYPFRVGVIEEVWCCGGTRPPCIVVGAY